MNRYTQRGSVLIGDGKFWGMGFGWPFARLTATNSGITLKWLWVKYEISKSIISTIRQYNPRYLTCGKGIKILHTNNQYPQDLVFWSFRRKKLLSELRKLGYTIDEME